MSSDVGEFVLGLRERLVTTFDLEEQHGADGGPWLRLGAQAPVGEARLWHGDDLARVAHVAVDLPDGSLSAHMLVAQTAATTAVPHLGVDMMKFPTGYGYFVDLLPKIDLAGNIAFTDEVYAPLDEVFPKLAKDDELTLVDMPPRMLAFYSPWMLHHFGSPDLERLSDVVAVYVDRFVDLLQGGITAGGLPATDEMAARDQRYRDVLFDPDFDPVWKQVTPLLGAEAVDTIRTTLGSALPVPANA